MVDDYTILRFDVNYAIGCNNLTLLIYRDIVNITLQNVPTSHHRSITQICRDNIALTSSYRFAVSFITTTSRHRSIMYIVLAKILLQHRDRLFHYTASTFIASYHIYIARIIPIISFGCKSSRNRLFVAQHF
ncbi:MAG: hypothetical protein N2247_03860 [Leptospiraceae bacterium]|jgi:hypothetical protein|nr:hypothetical protein [Leptospiraceae bacterium]